MFKVYRVKGENTDQCYYGYTEGVPLEKFLNHYNANPESVERGDTRMVVANGGVEGLKFEVLKEFEDEMDAFIFRNDRRRNDTSSIVRPSVYPTAVYERAIKHDKKNVVAGPGRGKKKEPCPSTESTARKAWKKGYYTNELIQSLGRVWDKANIIPDLDDLTPKQFDEKYGIIHS